MSLSDDFLSLEDFWRRRETRPTHRRPFRIYGRSVDMVSNDRDVLTAVDYVLPQYSQAAASGHAPWRIQLAVAPMRTPPGLAPANLIPRITYTGDASWLMLHLDGWGHAFVDMARGEATAVLDPALAADPELVSRALLNTILLNFAIDGGFAMLHASGLHRNGRSLLLMAPHNTGKSTTALRLILAGYPLISDSMIFVSPDDGALVGFPVGKIKLRGDMVPQFPRLHPHLVMEQVRDETKYTLDLRALDAGLVWDTAVAPDAIELCLLSRSGTTETFLTPADETAVWQAVMANSLFYDTQAVWQRNIATLRPVVARARWHHLAIGTDAAGIVTAVDRLFGHAG